jgi:hypothetical protein
MQVRAPNRGLLMVAPHPAGAARARAGFAADLPHGPQPGAARAHAGRGRRAAS